MRTGDSGWMTLVLLSVLVSGCGGNQQSSDDDKDATSAEPETTSASAIDPATVGEVTGQIVFNGQAPPRVRLRMQSVPSCVQANPEPTYSEDVIVNNNNTLRNVFVYVKEGLGNKIFPASTESPVLDQRGCVYSPHVLGVVVGQTLRIQNSDPANHNVHSSSNINRAWNQSMLPNGADLLEHFARPEVMVELKCNVHPWMKAYVGVTRSPFFAVSDETGSFTIKGLPPGTYKIAAWHEKYGTQDQQISLAPKQSIKINFAFKQ